jgi:hypothetical protein
MSVTVVCPGAILLDGVAVAVKAASWTGSNEVHPLLGRIGERRGTDRSAPRTWHTAPTPCPPTATRSAESKHMAGYRNTQRVTDRPTDCSFDSRRGFGRSKGCGGDGGESNSPSRTLRQEPLRACPMICRRPAGRPSAGLPPVQSRVPRSGLAPDYVTLVRVAAPLNDASTTHGAEVASTLTLPPKRRGREQAGGCQLLRFAACFTRPDGTSARAS